MPKPDILIIYYLVPDPDTKIMYDSAGISACSTARPAKVNFQVPVQCCLPLPTRQAIRANRVRRLQCSRSLGLCEPCQMATLYRSVVHMSRYSVAYLPDLRIKFRGFECWC